MNEYNLNQVFSLIELYPSKLKDLEQCMVRLPFHSSTLIVLDTSIHLIDRLVRRTFIRVLRFRSKLPYQLHMGHCLIHLEILLSFLKTRLSACQGISRNTKTFSFSQHQIGHPFCIRT